MAHDAGIKGQSIGSEPGPDYSNTVTTHALLLLAREDQNFISLSDWK